MKSLVKKSTKEIGYLAEEVALEYLIKKEFDLVRKNFFYQKGEIDLIVKKEDLLVFVEVKARSNNAFGYPEDSVSSKQKALIIEAAEFFVRDVQWGNNIRFDIISILFKRKSFQITHFEDAFY